MMMGEDIKADGIRFVLDEEGFTNPTDRLILTRKIISYLSKANEVKIDAMRAKTYGKKN